MLCHIVQVKSLVSVRINVLSVEQDSHLMMLQTVYHHALERAVLGLSFINSAKYTEAEHLAPPYLLNPKYIKEYCT